MDERLLMPSATITPSLTPRSGTPQQRQTQTQPPPIPPRATPSTMRSDEEAISRSRAGSVKLQAPPALPRRGSPAPALLSTSPNSTNPKATLPMAVRREPPPPPNGKAPTPNNSSSGPPAQEVFKPSSSTIDEIQRRRAISSPAKPVSGTGKMPPPVVPRSKVAMEADSPHPQDLIKPAQPDQKASAPSLPARKMTLPTSATTGTSITPKATPVTASRKPVPALVNEPPQKPKSETANRAIPVPASPRGTSQKTGSVADRLKQWEQINSQPPKAPRVVVPRSPTKPSSSFPPSPIKRPSDDGAKDRHAPPTKPVKPETLRKVSNTNGSSPPKP